jgi:hypothetical protein
MNEQENIQAAQRRLALLNANDIDGSGRSEARLFCVCSEDAFGWYTVRNGANR